MRNFADRARRAALWDGCSRLSGETLVAGSPDAPAAARRVQLLHSVLRPIRLAGQHSAADGSYAFEHIRHRPASDGYTVIAYDHTGVHDPVAKTNLVPSPMPPDPAEHP